MLKQQLTDNNGLIKFQSIGGFNFYGTYDPQHTTIKQIHVTLLLNYTCNIGVDLPDKNIELILETPIYNINIGN